MIRLLCLLAMTSVVSCKKSTQSAELKTIDNFAGSTFTWNSCAGDKGVIPLKLELSSSDERAVRKALTAVPQSWQKLFFEELKGKIRVSTNISEACSEPSSAVLSSSKLEMEMLFCSFDENGSRIITISGREGDPTFSSRNIGHVLVRAVAEAVYKHAGVEGKRREIASPIAQALLNDIAAMNTAEYSLSKFDAMLPESVLAKSLSPADRSKIFREQPEDSVEFFELHAFAESFDSLYCSTGSRDLLMSKFQGTFASLSSAEAKLEALLKKDGFSFTGRPNTPGSSNSVPSSSFYGRRVAPAKGQQGNASSSGSKRSSSACLSLESSPNTQASSNIGPSKGSSWARYKPGC